jgi:hypothetical protein
MRKFKDVLNTTRAVMFMVSLTCIMAMTSCKHDNFTDHVGPAMCPTADFAITQSFLPANATVNFANDSIIFTAAFNEVISWSIKVTGRTTGASITFSGKDDNINTVWRGNPGSLVFFGVETADVVLTIPCREAITTTVTITGKGNFMNCGVLISDFDGNGMIPNAGWARFGAPSLIGTNSSAKNAPLVSPQAPYYWHLYGTPSSSSWYVGGISSPISITDLGTNDPDSVYFNVLLNSNSNSLGLLQIGISQNGTYYNYNVPFDWSGWKLISFKLSDIKITNPSQVDALQFGLNCKNQPGDTPEANFDFIIFTKGQPFF